MKFHSNKSKQGFTLIELLMVIAIIGLLASTILIAVNRARFKATSEVIKREFDQLEIIAQVYYDSLNRKLMEYPSDPNNADWGNLQLNAGVCPTSGAQAAGTLFGYPDMATQLESIRSKIPGSTLECMATNDTNFPFTSPPARKWAIHLQAPGNNGGTNHWCIDNLGFSGSGQRSANFFGGVPVVVFCSAVASPDW